MKKRDIFLYDVYQERGLPFVLGEYSAHFGNSSMMLNVSSYEPISMLPTGFFSVFSKCSYSAQEMGSSKFVQKNVSQHFQKYQTNMLHFHGLAWSCCYATAYNVLC